MAKRIIDFNHISDKLTEDQVRELRAYYCSYHRKCWAFKQATKRLKKYKLIGNSLSVIFAGSGVASAIATSGISLVAISTVSLLIQGYMKHKNIDLRIQNWLYARQSYQHLIDTIKNNMRAGEFNIDSLHIMMNNIDSYVADNAPVIDKFLQKYDKIFT